jgi:hypothetical protein
MLNAGAPYLLNIYCVEDNMHPEFLINDLLKKVPNHYWVNWDSFGETYRLFSILINGCGIHHLSLIR